MMNEERELLERWVSQFGNLRHDFNLLTKTKELLAQPEPIKEREVSGKIISTDDSCNWNLTVGGLKDYDHVYVNGIRYTEYQPDINTQYLLDQVSRLTAENAMIKEKWSEAQPEQEQEPVGYLYKQMDCTGEWATIFKVEKPYITWHDIKDIVTLYTAPPKRKFLSVKQAKDIWGTTFKSAVPYYTFYEICVAIEKAHGIGGKE
jgi:hypothetical protein